MKDGKAPKDGVRDSSLQFFPHWRLHSRPTFPSRLWSITVQPYSLVSSQGGQWVHISVVALSVCPSGRHATQATSVEEIQALLPVLARDENLAKLS